MTPTLSVEAVHASAIWVLDDTVANKFSGAVGGVVSLGLLLLLPPPLFVEVPHPKSSSKARVKAIETETHCGVVTGRMTRKRVLQVAVVAAAAAQAGVYGRKYATFFQDKEKIT